MEKKNVTTLFGMVLRNFRGTNFVFGRTPPGGNGDFLSVQKKNLSVGRQNVGWKKKVCRLKKNVGWRISPAKNGNGGWGCFQRHRER